MTPLNQFAYSDELKDIVDSVFSKRYSMDVVVYDPEFHLFLENHS